MDDKVSSQLRNESRHRITKRFGRHSYPLLWMLIMAVTLMGLASMQTFQVRNLSENPDSIDNWRLASRPDFTWIFTIVVGCIVFTYGFVGFWFTERRRKLWRIYLHCI